MERVEVALESVKIYTDYVGVYASRLKNLTSINTYTFDEDDNDKYVEWLLKVIDEESYWKSGEPTKPIRREKIKKVRKSRGCTHGFKNTESQRNKFYDLLCVPTASATEHGENQLLGCIYEIEEGFSKAGEDKNVEYLLLFYVGGVTRVYELTNKEVLNVRQGKLTMGKVVTVYKGEVMMFDANINDWKEAIE